MINKMLLYLERRGVYVVGYADEVATSVRGKFPNALANLM